MDPRLLDILVCPLCKGKLRFDRQNQELVCRADRLAYPVRDDIPLLLESAARRWEPEAEAAPAMPAPRAP
ncbi:MAG: Trm112 family protein [Pigmentiphaga sp.]|nr:Trm112 family protein [Pigmentiphaga sp.]